MSPYFASTPVPTIVETLSDLLTPAYFSVFDHPINTFLDSIVPIVPIYQSVEQQQSQQYIPIIHEQPQQPVDHQTESSFTNQLLKRTIQTRPLKKSSSTSRKSPTQRPPSPIPSSHGTETSDQDSTCNSTSKSATLPRLFTCTHPGCTRAFTRLENLKSHTVSHSTSNEPKQHQCVLCSASFRRGHDLLRHQRAKHSPERPHKCPNCPASFARRDAFKKHWEFEEREMERMKKVTGNGLFDFDDSGTL
ncbi:hypothetical protein HDU76_009335, partial [Blyttiomyces sp. JEL0837]